MSLERGFIEDCGAAMINRKFDGFYAVWVTSKYEEA